MRGNGSNERGKMLRSRERRREGSGRGGKCWLGIGWEKGRREGIGGRWDGEREVGWTREGVRGRWEKGGIVGVEMGGKRGGVNMKW